MTRHNVILFVFALTTVAAMCWAPQCPMQGWHLILFVFGFFSAAVFGYGLAKTKAKKAGELAFQQKLYKQLYDRQISLMNDNDMLKDKIHRLKSIKRKTPKSKIRNQK